MFCAHLCACWWIYQTWAWHHQPARTKQRINKVLHINTHTRTHTLHSMGCHCPSLRGSKKGKQMERVEGDRGWGDRWWRREENQRQSERERGKKSGEMSEEESTVSKNKTKYNLSRWKRSERVPFWRRRRKFFPILCQCFLYKLLFLFISPLSSPHQRCLSLPGHKVYHSHGDPVKNFN